ncbi:MAG: heat-inducible transcriptional repressor HrcA, partial [Mangrovicoccus sp.]
MAEDSMTFEDMNDRTREVFRRVVESYLLTGEPVGSRSLTRTMAEKVSAATIRNVMQDLEYMGLLNAPHISAGRMPTERGLRMFIDGFMEVQDLDDADRSKIEATVGGEQLDVPTMLDNIGSALSGVTQGASLV